MDTVYAEPVRVPEIYSIPYQLREMLESRTRSDELTEMRVEDTTPEITVRDLECPQCHRFNQFLFPLTSESWTPEEWLSRAASLRCTCLASLAGVLPDDTPTLMPNLDSDDESETPTLMPNQDSDDDTLPTPGPETTPAEEALYDLECRHCDHINEFLLLVMTPDRWTSDGWINATRDLCCELCERSLSGTIGQLAAPDSATPSS